MINGYFWRPNEHDDLTDDRTPSEGQLVLDGMEYLVFINPLCDKEGKHGVCADIKCKCTCHPSTQKQPTDPALKNDY